MAAYKYGDLDVPLGQKSSKEFEKSKKVQKFQKVRRDPQLQTTILSKQLFCNISFFCRKLMPSFPPMPSWAPTWQIIFQVIRTALVLKPQKRRHRAGRNDRRRLLSTLGLGRVHPAAPHLCAFALSWLTDMMIASSASLNCPDKAFQGLISYRRSQELKSQDPELVCCWETVGVVR